jgi:hypothetical protein
VRQAEARIIELDRSHAAYVSALERRATARRESARLKREQAIAKSKGDLDEVITNPRATEDQRTFQRQMHVTEIARYEALVMTMARVTAIDEGFRAMGDRFVVSALQEATSEDGGRTVLRRLSGTADTAIAVGGVIPATAPFAAVAALVMKALDLAAGKVDRGPRPAPDERYEAAALWLQVAARMMDAWTAAVTANSPDVALG